MSSSYSTEDKFSNSVDVTSSYIRLMQLSNRIDYRTQWAHLCSKLVHKQQLSMTKQIASYHHSLISYRKKLISPYFNHWKRKRPWYHFTRALVHRCHKLYFTKIKEIFDRKKHEILKIPWRRISELLLKRNHERILVQEFANLQNIRMARKLLKKWIQNADQKRSKFRFRWRSLSNRYSHINLIRNLAIECKELNSRKKWISVYDRERRINLLKNLLQAKRRLDMQRKWQSFVSRSLKLSKSKTALIKSFRIQKWRSFEKRILRIRKMQNLVFIQKRFVYQQKWYSLVYRIINLMNKRTLETGRQIAINWMINHDRKQIYKKYFPIWVDRAQKKHYSRSTLRRCFSSAIREYTFSMANTSAAIIQRAFRNSTKKFSNRKKERLLRRAFSRWLSNYVLLTKCRDKPPSLIEQIEVPSFSMKFADLPFDIPSVNDFSKTMFEVSSLRNLKQVRKPGKLLSPPRSDAKERVELNLSPVHSLNISKNSSRSKGVNDIECGSVDIPYPFESPRKEAEEEEEEEEEEKKKKYPPKQPISIAQPKQEEMQQPKKEEEIQQPKKEEEIQQPKEDEDEEEIQLPKEDEEIQLPKEDEEIQLPKEDEEEEEIYQPKEEEDIQMPEEDDTQKFDDLIKDSITNNKYDPILPTLFELNVDPLNISPKEKPKNLKQPEIIVPVEEEIEPPEEEEEIHQPKKEEEVEQPEYDAGETTIPEHIIKEATEKHDYDPILPTLFNLNIYPLNITPNKKPTTSTNTIPPETAPPKEEEEEIQQSKKEEEEEIQQSKKEEETQLPKEEEEIQQPKKEDDEEDISQIEQPEIDVEETDIPDRLIQESTGKLNFDPILPTLFKLNVDPLNMSPNQKPKDLNQPEAAIPKKEEEEEEEEEQDEKEKHPEEEPASIEEINIPESLIRDSAGSLDLDAILPTLLTLNIEPLNITPNTKESHDTQPEEAVQNPEIPLDDVINSSIKDEYDSILPSLFKLNLSPLNLSPRKQTTQESKEPEQKEEQEEQDLEADIPNELVTKLIPDLEIDSVLPDLYSPSIKFLVDIDKADNKSPIQASREEEEEGIHEQKEQEIPDNILNISNDFDSILPTLFNLNVLPLNVTPNEKVLNAKPEQEKTAKEEEEEEEDHEINIPNDVILKLTPDLEVDSILPGLYLPSLKPLDNIENHGVDQADKDENKEEEEDNESQVEKESEIPQALLSAAFKPSELDPIIPTLFKLDIDPLNTLMKRPETIQTESKENKEEEHPKEETHKEEEETAEKEQEIPSEIIKNLIKDEYDPILPTLFKLNVLPLNISPNKEGKLENKEEPKPVIPEKQEEENVEPEEQEVDIPEDIASKLIPKEEIEEVVPNLYSPNIQPLTNIESNQFQEPTTEEGKEEIKDSEEPEAVIPETKEEANVEAEENEEQEVDIPEDIASKLIPKEEIEEVVPNLYSPNIQPLTNIESNQFQEPTTEEPKEEIKKDDTKETPENVKDTEKEPQENKEEEIPETLLNEALKPNEFDPIIPTLFKLDIDPLNALSKRPAAKQDTIPQPAENAPENKEAEPQEGDEDVSNLDIPQDLVSKLIEPFNLDEVCSKLPALNIGPIDNIERSNQIEELPSIFDFNEPSSKQNEEEELENIFNFDSNSGSKKSKESRSQSEEEKIFDLTKNLKKQVTDSLDVDKILPTLPKLETKPLEMFISSQREKESNEPEKDLVDKNEEKKEFSAPNEIDKQLDEILPTLPDLSSSKALDEYQPKEKKEEEKPKAPEKKEEEKPKAPEKKEEENVEAEENEEQEVDIPEDITSKLIPKEEIENVVPNLYSPNIQPLTNIESNQFQEPTTEEGKEEIKDSEEPEAVIPEKQEEENVEAEENEEQEVDIPEDIASKLIPKEEIENVVPNLYSPNIQPLTNIESNQFQEPPTSQIENEKIHEEEANDKGEELPIDIINQSINKEFDPILPTLFKLNVSPLNITPKEKMNNEEPKEEIAEEEPFEETEINIPEEITTKITPELELEPILPKLYSPAIHFLKDIEKLNIPTTEEPADEASNGNKEEPTEKEQGTSSEPEEYEEQDVNIADDIISKIMPAKDIENVIPKLCSPNISPLSNIESNGIHEIATEENQEPPEIEEKKEEQPEDQIKEEEQDIPSDIINQSINKEFDPILPTLFKLNVSPLNITPKEKMNNEEPELPTPDITDDNIEEEINIPKEILSELTTKLELESVLPEICTATIKPLENIDKENETPITDLENREANDEHPIEEIHKEEAVEEIEFEEVKEEANDKGEELPIDIINQSINKEFDPILPTLFKLNVSPLNIAPKEKMNNEEPKEEIAEEEPFEETEINIPEEITTKITPELELEPILPKLYSPAIHFLKDIEKLNIPTTEEPTGEPKDLSQSNSDEVIQNKENKEEEPPVHKEEEETAEKEQEIPSEIIKNLIKDEYDPILPTLFKLNVLPLNITPNKEESKPSLPEKQEEANVEAEENEEQEVDIPEDIASKLIPKEEIENVVPNLYSPNIQPLTNIESNQFQDPTTKEIKDSEEPEPVIPEKQEEENVEPEEQEVDIPEDIASKLIPKEEIEEVVPNLYSPNIQPLTNIESNQFQEPTTEEGKEEIKDSEEPEAVIPETKEEANVEAEENEEQEVDIPEDIASKLIPKEEIENVVPNLYSPNIQPLTNIESSGIQEPPTSQIEDEKIHEEEEEANDKGEELPIDIINQSINKEFDPILPTLFKLNVSPLNITPKEKMNNEEPELPTPDITDDNIEEEINIPKEILSELTTKLELESVLPEICTATIKPLEKLEKVEKENEAPVTDLENREANEEHPIEEIHKEEAVEEIEFEEVKEETADKGEELPIDIINQSINKEFDPILPTLFKLNVSPLNIAPKEKMNNEEPEEEIAEEKSEIDVSDQQKQEYEEEPKQDENLEPLDPSKVIDQFPFITEYENVIKDAVSDELKSLDSINPTFVNLENDEANDENEIIDDVTSGIKSSLPLNNVFAQLSGVTNLSTPLNTMTQGAIRPPAGYEEEEEEEEEHKDVDNEIVNPDEIVDFKNEIAQIFGNELNPLNFIDPKFIDFNEYEMNSSDIVSDVANSIKFDISLQNLQNPTMNDDEEEEEEFIQNDKSIESFDIADEDDSLNEKSLDDLGQTQLLKEEEEEEEMIEYDITPVCEEIGNLLFNLNPLISDDIKSRVSLILNYSQTPPQIFDIDESSRQIAFENISSLQLDQLSQLQKAHSQIQNPPPLPSTSSSQEQQKKTSFKDILPFETLLNYDTPTPSFSKLESTTDLESTTEFSKMKNSNSNLINENKSSETKQFDLPFEYIDDGNDEIEYDEYQVETPDIDINNYLNTLIVNNTNMPPLSAFIPSLLGDRIKKDVDIVSKRVAQNSPLSKSKKDYFKEEEEEEEEEFLSDY
ncbi:hypothetical protein M9Y10_023585 [Tritrichomonas musculus]|uniref:IQ calmodulin-binding motif family protein n=1 Tax=Tritrichomonas musculus TaxID=1915356 RepID=A0ABR2KWB8_9EUKA